MARLLADQFESLDDVRPAESSVVWDDDELRFSFTWPREGWEILLSWSGEDERVIAYRVELLKAVTPALAEVVEITGGREVDSHRSCLDETGLRAMVSFELGSSPAADSELAEGLRNWSEQVRRNARAQRAEHRRRVDELRRSVKAIRDTEARKPRRGRD